MGNHQSLEDHAAISASEQVSRMVYGVNRMPTAKRKPQRSPSPAPASDEAGRKLQSAWSDILKAQGFVDLTTAVESFSASYDVQVLLACIAERHSERPEDTATRFALRYVDNTDWEKIDPKYRARLFARMLKDEVDLYGSRRDAAQARWDHEIEAPLPQVDSERSILPAHSEEQKKQLGDRIESFWADFGWELLVQFVEVRAQATDRQHAFEYAFDKCIEGEGDYRTFYPPWGSAQRAAQDIAGFLLGDSAWILGTRDIPRDNIGRECGDDPSDGENDAPDAYATSLKPTKDLSWQAVKAAAQHTTLSWRKIYIRILRHIDTFGATNTFRYFLQEPCARSIDSSDDAEWRGSRLRNRARRRTGDTAMAALLADHFVCEQWVSRKIRVPDALRVPPPIATSEDAISAWLGEGVADVASIRDAPDATDGVVNYPVLISGGGSVNGSVSTPPRRPAEPSVNAPAGPTVNGRATAQAKTGGPKSIAPNPSATTAKPTASAIMPDPSGSPAATEAQTEAEIIALQTVNNDLQRELDTLQADNQLLRDNNASVILANDKLVDSNAELQGHLDKYEDAAADVVMLECELDELKEKHEALEAEKTELEQQVADSDGRYTELQQQLLDLKSELETAKEQPQEAFAAPALIPCPICGRESYSEVQQRTHLNGHRYELNRYRRQNGRRGYNPDLPPPRDTDREDVDDDYDNYDESNPLYDMQRHQRPHERYGSDRHDEDRDDNYDTYRDRHESRQREYGEAFRPRDYERSRYDRPGRRPLLRGPRQSPFEPRDYDHDSGYGRRRAPTRYAADDEHPDERDKPYEQHPDLFDQGRLGLRDSRPSGLSRRPLSQSPSKDAHNYWKNILRERGYLLKETPSPPTGTKRKASNFTGDYDADAEAEVEGEDTPDYHSTHRRKRPRTRSVTRAADDGLVSALTPSEGWVLGAQVYHEELASYVTWQGGNVWEDEGGKVVSPPAGYERRFRFAGEDPRYRYTPETEGEAEERRRKEGFGGVEGAEDIHKGDKWEETDESY